MNILIHENYHTLGAKIYINTSIIFLMLKVTYAKWELSFKSNPEAMNIWICYLLIST